MNRKRILVIEDNPVLRERINAMLAREPEMRVVATLGSGDNILVKIRETQPEMVLLGVGLNHTTEASVIALARELAPGINVICMGLVPSYPGIASLVEAGAAGFILEPLGSGKGIAKRMAVVRMCKTRIASQERAGAKQDRRVGVIDEFRHDPVM